jgi:hypothetical protein
MSERQTPPETRDKRKKDKALSPKPHQQAS